MVYGHFKLIIADTVDVSLPKNLHHVVGLSPTTLQISAPPIFTDV
jgi:hypothetical protein